MVLRGTLREHFRPFPSPKGAASHARGTFLPLSVAQQCITARSGNTSTRFRHPRVPRRTPGEHFCHYPSPDGAPGNTYAPFRRLTAPRRTPGEHFGPVPSPNGASQHARATLQPHSVAQRGITARSGNISATIRRPTAHYRTPGRHLRPFPSPGRSGTGDGREAGPGRSLGRSLGGGWTGGWTGGRKRQRDRHGHKSSRR